jgi:DNA-binding XRE family transcriptional regulator
MTANPSAPPDAPAGERAILAPAQLREFRLALGMTQKQLAAELDLTEVTLGRWEAGLAPIGSPRRTRLALLAMLHGYRGDGSRGPRITLPGTC